jgi:hypothetical protein
MGYESYNRALDFGRKLPRRSFRNTPSTNAVATMSNNKSMTCWEASVALRNEWDAARPKILLSIAQTLSRANSQRWFPAADLLPDAFNSTASWRTLCSKAISIGVTGAQALEAEGYYLLRHRWAGSYYIWSCPTNAFPRNVPMENVAMTAISQHEDSSVAYRADQLRSKIESDCKEHFEKVKRAINSKNEAKRRKDTITVDSNGISTRSAEAILDLMASPTGKSFETFQSLDPAIQKQVHAKLMEGQTELVKLKDTLRQIQDEQSAIGVLKQFDSVFVNRSYVSRVVNSKEAKQAGSIAPRAAGFEDLGDRSQHEISTVLAAISVRIAQILLPQDSKEGNALLLQAMVENDLFQRHVLPNHDEESYEAWRLHPAVVRIKKEVESLGSSNYDMKVKLLSLLSSYPKKWVSELIPSVGESSMKDAKLAAALKDSNVKFVVTGDATTRNRRFGPKEDFLMEWFGRDKNTTFSALSMACETTRRTFVCAQIVTDTAQNRGRSSDNASNYCTARLTSAGGKHLTR